MNAFDFLLSHSDSLASLAEPLSVLSNAMSQPSVPRLAWMPSVDIVVPNLVSEPTAGLDLTVSSIEVALQNSGLDYRYFIVNNGNPLSGEERNRFNRCMDYLKSTGRVGQIFHIPEPMSPPAARNLGVAAGDGEVIFCFDNHIKVYEGFFNHVLNTLQETGCASVHGKMLSRYDAAYYHYKLTLEKNFWGSNWNIPHGDGATPYRIAHGNHGAFAVRRSVWEAVGGYWDGFEGYGAEEPEFNLKLALLDHASYLNPLATHWHHFAKRSYSQGGVCPRMNFICAANIIGGERWAEKVKNGLLNWDLHNQNRHKELLPSAYDQILAEAMVKSAPAAQWLAAHRKRTLDEQLELWKREGVAH
jgi:hypothetical protein